MNREMANGARGDGVTGDGTMGGGAPGGAAGGGAVGEIAIRVEHVRKEFDGGKVVALDDVSLEVPAGQLLVIIGLSGSGKSTLLRHLNRLHEPTSGRIEVLGHDLARAGRSELRRVRRDVGFVFQQFNIVGRLTALENVLSGALGRLRGPRYGVLTYSTALRRQAWDQLDRVGLADRAFQRADTLSGGQQQRVAIARTLMQQPRVVLADEPVASLDPEISGQVMETLFRVTREDNLTVVTSLHQIELALGWAQRMIGLRDGRVVLDRDAAGLTTDEVMTVYSRLDPTGAKRAEYEGTSA
ncbi:MAG: phosphonate ABC transporter ATP-binding protein [Acidimicrobiales bacterium]